MKIRDVILHRRRSKEAMVFLGGCYVLYKLGMATAGTAIAMEILILLGGCYAFYTVGMAIKAEIDYREANRK